MKDFQLRNDIKLLFRSDLAGDLSALVAGKKVLFVYGGGSARKNGCYARNCGSFRSRELASESG